MKKRTLLFVFSTITSIGIAQNINYEIIKDEPIEPTVSVCLDLINIDLNSEIENIRIDNISMNIGAFGYVKPLSNIGVDFRFHKSWFVAGKLGFKDYPGNFEMSTGAHLLLTNSTTTKDTKVILKSGSSRTGNRETTTTTYITVPAKRTLRLGARVGIYQKSGPFNFGDYSDSFLPGTIEETKISSTGIYLGLLSRTLRNIIIKDDTYGKSFNSGGSDLYFDVLIIPRNKFTNLKSNTPADQLDVTDVVKGFKKQGPIGFRIGYTKYASEIKTFTGKKFGLSGFGEFGYKPYQGISLTAGFGITLIKSSKKFGKPKSDE